MTAFEIAEIIRSHGYSVAVRGYSAVASLSRRPVSISEIDAVLMDHGLDLDFALDRVGNTVYVVCIS